MWFERIEREISDGEPWAEFSINRMEWGGEKRDCWELNSSSEKQLSKRWFRIQNFKFLQNLPWVKTQSRQQDLL
ncbi:hypothetical protein NIES4073_21150 [Kalymmatonema gypsitolerans NIES-4073]|jgi:hypothetical protein|nr:hypothetical protein NIES4073_21150 [Scytonema sp. NIES-4073]